MPASNIGLFSWVEFWVLFCVFLGRLPLLTIPSLCWVLSHVSMDAYHSADDTFAVSNTRTQSGSPTHLLLFGLPKDRRGPCLNRPCSHASQDLPTKHLPPTPPFHKSRLLDINCTFKKLHVNVIEKGVFSVALIRFLWFGETVVRATVMHIVALIKF